MIITSTTNGVMIRCKEIPEDFNASNSLCSPMFPKVMIDERSIDSGSARGTNPAEAYNNNSPITESSSPLPTRSSMYFHKNCIKRRNTAMKKVKINGPIYDLNVRVCRRFTIQINYIKLILKNVCKAKIFFKKERILIVQVYVLIQQFEYSINL